MMGSNFFGRTTRCSIHSSDLGGSANHERKLTMRIDGLQRFEQRLDQRSRFMIVALLGDLAGSALAPIGYGS